MKNNQPSPPRGKLPWYLTWWAMIIWIVLIVIVIRVVLGLLPAM